MCLVDNQETSDRSCPAEISAEDSSTRRIRKGQAEFRQILHVATLGVDGVVSQMPGVLKASRLGAEIEAAVNLPAQLGQVEVAIVVRIKELREQDP
jgi:hypothetical protein